MKPTIIGLTGNIGTGKTTILNLLRRRGARTIDADKVTHQVMAPGGKAYDAIVVAFGPDIVRPDGTINRSRLGRIVFADPGKLALLESIVHPAVYEVVSAEAEQASEQVVVIEAIKLLEAGMSSALCDQIWVVTSPIEAQIERLMAERGMSRAEAEARMASQSPQASKINQADVVIDNSGSLEDLAAQVSDAWANLGLPQPA